MRGIKLTIACRVDKEAVDNFAHFLTEDLMSSFYNKHEAIILAIEINASHVKMIEKLNYHNNI